VPFTHFANVCVKPRTTSVKTLSRTTYIHRGQSPEIQKQLNEWRTEPDSWMRIIDILQQEAHDNPQPVRSISDEDRTRIKHRLVCAKTESGQLSCALRILTSLGTVVISEEVIERLQALHPFWSRHYMSGSARVLSSPQRERSVSRRRHHIISQGILVRPTQINPRSPQGCPRDSA
jgi:hypothetical protein